MHFQLSPSLLDVLVTYNHLILIWIIKQNILKLIAFNSSALKVKKLTYSLTINIIYITYIYRYYINNSNTSLITVPKWPLTSGSIPSHHSKCLTDFGIQAVILLRTAKLRTKYYDKFTFMSTDSLSFSLLTILMATFLPVMQWTPSFTNPERTRWIYTFKRFEAFA